MKHDPQSFSPLDEACMNNLALLEAQVPPGCFSSILRSFYCWFEIELELSYRMAELVLASEVASADLPNHRYKHWSPYC